MKTCAKVNFEVISPFPTFFYSLIIHSRINSAGKMMTPVVSEPAGGWYSLHPYQTFFHTPAFEPLLVTVLGKTFSLCTKQR